MVTYFCRVRCSLGGLITIVGLDRRYLMLDLGYMVDLGYGMETGRFEGFSAFLMGFLDQMGI